ncbi:MAG: hypothetical protein ABSB39_11250 [Candidatus Sulfotelmatobacter sp.]
MKNGRVRKLRFFLKSARKVMIAVAKESTLFARSIPLAEMCGNILSPLFDSLCPVNFKRDFIPPMLQFPRMAEETEAKKKKALTAEDFITKWPLYTPFNFEEYSPPARISFHCPNHDCSKETTWALSNKANFLTVAPNFYHVHYQCTLCQSFNLVVCYLRVGYKTRQIIGPTGQEPRHFYSQALKIGQYPALSIKLSKALEKNLGEHHAALYKKALANRNEGYGLGAVSYIRRVVEDKTEELIEVVAQLAQSHNIDPEVIKQIRSAKDEKTTYDKKLKLAATVMPDSLVIDGVNPLDALYGLVSAGLHDLTEEECIEIADETQSVFEFTFTRLRAETKERKDFADKIKKWAGGNSPAAKTPKSGTPEKNSAEPSKTPLGI